MRASDKVLHDFAVALTVLLIAVLPVALLAACGEPVVGTVVSQNHRPSWVELYSQPMYGSRCSGTGKSRSCYSTVVGYYPATRFHAERWDLIVRDANGKNHTVSVHHQTFLNRPVGSSFSEVK